MSAISQAFSQPRAAIRTIGERVPTSRAAAVKTARALRYRASAPDYLTFYRQLQNQKVRDGDAYPRNGVGDAQFEFLRDHGLQPDDRLLDIGCGDLRGGIHAIRYLERGNYAGIDISAAAIGDAVTNVERDGLREKRPRLLVNDDLRFSEFEADAFDYILANSVFTHLPREYIRQCLQHVGVVLADDGEFFASFHPAENSHRVPSLSTSGSDSFRYPFVDLKAMAAAADLEAEQLPYERHPSDRMEMVAFRPR